MKKIIYPFTLCFCLAFLFACDNPATVFDEPATVSNAPVPTKAEEQLAGLTVASENRCTEYRKKKDYPYSPSVEQKIIDNQGGHFSPFTGEKFTDLKQTDIEHIVATSEAHDSGLCAQDRAIKKQFASDLDNLTTASPSVNRHQKSGKDVGEWIPTLLTLENTGETNHCWMAKVVINVKSKYSLTIDPLEKQALVEMLGTCLNP